MEYSEEERISPCEKLTDLFAARVLLQTCPRTKPPITPILILAVVVQGGGGLVQVAPQNSALQISRLQ